MVYCPEYFEIIGNRLLHPIDKGERHHIYPKSCGGSNSESNLVMLTPAEHIRCHYLLVDMFQDEPKKRRKMACALHFISHTRDGKKLTVEEYAAIREAHAKAVSEMLKGHEVSIEARQKISEKKLGRKDSEETRRKKSEGHKGQTSPWKGKKHSKEYCQKMSASLKGRVCPNIGKLWFHNETKSFRCFPDDPKVESLHLIPGRL